MNEVYIHCFIACLIGNVIHILALARSRYVDYDKLNEKLPFGEFLVKEKWGILLDFFGSMGIVYAADEWIVDNPFIMGKIKTLFIFIGITGSWAIMQLVSRTKKNFRGTLDTKSNIADYGTDKKPS
jgi:hypothetical protein